MTALTNDTASAWAPSRRILTAGLVFMVTAAAFEGLAVPTVLPATLADLGGLSLYGWAFSAFWLTSLLGVTLAGQQADRGDAFRPFIAGVALFAVGLAVAGLAPSMLVVVIGRAIQGLGSGAIGSVIWVATARGYAPDAKPRMIAIVSSAWVIPGLVGPAIAGAVAEHLSWRWVFLALVPLLPLAALLVARPIRSLPVGLPRDPDVAPGAGGGAAMLPDVQDAAHVPHPPRGIRTRDALMLAVGAGAVLTAVSIRQPLVAIGIGVAGLVAARAALARLLPPGTLLGRSGPPAAVASTGLLSLAFFGAEAFVPLAVATVRGAGPVAGGLALTASSVTWAAGSWIQARLAPTRSRRLIVATGVALVVLGIVIETAVLVPGVPVAVAALAWAVGGLGMGLAYSTTTLVILETAPAGGEGAASAAVQLANVVGIALGTGLGGALVATIAPLAGIEWGIVLANALLVALGGLGIWLATRMPDRPATPPQVALSASRIEAEG